MLRGSVILMVLFFVRAGVGLYAQDDILTRLGYPEDARLLIIHADDLGVSHSENVASISGMEKGQVNSASIMVPCPWFPEIAAYARENPKADLGLHLTLNSEWLGYKWGPVSSRDAVSSLINEQGYFYASVDSLRTYGKANEVALELTNQVIKALEAGIDITHLDAHMGAAVSTPEFMAAYLRVGRAFDLPVLLDKRVYEMTAPEIRNLIDDRTVIMDNIYSMTPADFTAGPEQYYKSLLAELPSGLNCLLIHLAYEDEEMKAVTKGHDYWAADWRQADSDFFLSETCQNLIEQENIILISWRELRDKITRSK